MAGHGGAAALALALVLALPAVAAEWFDAYEDGLQALERGQGQRAAEHFERAVRLRPEPGTNLLTYGTNRLERYHPYLKLAEAYLIAGEPEKAREALARSEQRGREPADERSRLAARLQTALQARAPNPAPALQAALATPAPLPLPSASALVPVAPSPATTPAPAPSVVPTAQPSATLTPGTLELRSDPDGATVFAGNRLLGSTPLTVELAPGVYELTLRRAGAVDSKFSVRIEAGRRTSESRTLVATGPAPSAEPSTQPELAALLVISQPGGAAVYLDDELIGTTEALSGRLVKSGVTPGSHSLRVTAPGLAEQVQAVEIAASGPTTVRAVLAPTATSGRNALLAVVFGLLVVALTVGAWVAFGRRRSRLAPEARSASPGASAGSRATAVMPPTVGTNGPAITHPGDAEPTAALPSADATRPGAPEVFGEYLLLGPLGKGGMAAVFKAERRGEICALKRPLSVFVEEPEFIQRFVREAQIGRTLHHPNIIRIFEQGTVGSVPYFTMELVRGQTLQEHLRGRGRLDGRAATQLVAQVAEALDYAHLKGVVHRDLKPSNIMVLEGGLVKVMDYGIARARRFEGLTMTGNFLGTPDYVAPETAEGRVTDARSDLYSLGVVFFEIVTGRRPFRGDTPFATLRKHCVEPPPPPSSLVPDCPPELEAIILKLLAKDPAERFPGAEELLVALRDWLNRAA